MKNKDNAKKISVSIVTDRSGASREFLSTLFDEDIDEILSEAEDGQDGEEDPDENEHIESISEGIIRDDGVNTVIEYEENELSGMSGSITSVTFGNDTPGVVSMIREGIVSTALTFETHRRHICQYEAPFLSFEVSVHTILVDNRIKSDGILKLDYVIEIHGAQAERTILTMKIKEIS